MADLDDQIRRHGRGEDTDREDSSKGHEGYVGRNEEESLLIDFARLGISENPDMPFSLYCWEAKALLDGARLHQLDERRFMLEQAVNTANFQSAKKANKIVKKAYRVIDKQADDIIKGRTSGRKDTDHGKLQILEKVRQAFGGGN